MVKEEKKVFAPGRNNGSPRRALAKCERYREEWSGLAVIIGWDLRKMRKRVKQTL